MGEKEPYILAAAVILIIALFSYGKVNFYGGTETIPANISAEGSEGITPTEIIAQGLDTPWAIDFLPDGRMIFTERPGRINIVDESKIKLAGEISVNEASESGLHGITVDPEFEENNFIYVYYTHETANRVSRFKLTGDKITNEYILLDGIPNARFHDGGRIKFGPDGKLYITTGDATVPSTAQDLNSLAGKILRMNKDGSAPSDNPFNNLVYSYGHRNPQGLAWNFENNVMYSSEHGPSANDEVNIISAGKNYGWPDECTDDGNFTQPLRCFKEFTLAPSGMAFYKGDLYVAGLRGSQLRKLTLSESKIISEEEILSNLGRIREVVEHKGSLYVATSNYDGRGIPRPGDDKIIRVF